MNKTLLITGAILICGIGAGMYLSFQKQSPSPVAGEPSPSPQQSEQKLPSPAFQLDRTKTYSAVIHTSEGDIAVLLHGSDVPQTVNNFVVLARQGFYKDTIFHRVLKGFMIQGGDPTGTGRGGPGYSFNDEPFQGEYTRGTLAMANAGPNTNGSQFFIMHDSMPLEPHYVIFGHVTKGIEAVDKIATAPVVKNEGGENSKPAKPAKILGVDISEQGI